MPVQFPLTQAWLTQATAGPQVPVLAQVCTPLPEHCVCPGVHWLQLAEELELQFGSQM
jgi:hypothetical protein